METDHVESGSNSSSNVYLIPLAIIIAGAIVATAIFFRGGSTQQADSPMSPENDEPASLTIKPVDSTDHIYGNPNAPVKIIEFVDLECPFCKKFHFILKQVIDAYGKDGKVAWVFRHFPLDSIHSKARREATASECAAELGGHAKFWEFVDEIFRVTPSNDGLDPTELINISERVGLNKNEILTCIDSGRFAKKIDAQLQDAVDSGGRGTPWSIVINSKGKKFPINGALPYEAVKQVIEEALK